jgi:hypothetical protein
MKKKMRRISFWMVRYAALGGADSKTWLPYVAHYKDRRDARHYAKLVKKNSSATFTGVKVSGPHWIRVPAA